MGGLNALGMRPTLLALKTSLLGTGGAGQIDGTACFQLLFPSMVPKTSWEKELLQAIITTVTLQCIF